MKRLGRWRGAVDKKSGKIYYFHTATREVSWVMPQEMIDRQSKKAGRNISPQVKEAFTSKGVKYFLSDDEFRTIKDYVDKKDFYRARESLMKAVKGFQRNENPLIGALQEKIKKSKSFDIVLDVKLVGEAFMKKEASRTLSKSMAKPLSSSLSRSRSSQPSGKTPTPNREVRAPSKIPAMAKPPSRKILPPDRSAKARPPPPLRSPARPPPKMPSKPPTVPQRHPSQKIPPKFVPRPPPKAPPKQPAPPQRIHPPKPRPKLTPRAPAKVPPKPPTPRRISPPKPSPRSTPLAPPKPSAPQINVPPPIKKPQITPPIPTPIKETPPPKLEPRISLSQSKSESVGERNELLNQIHKGMKLRSVGSKSKKKIPKPPPSDNNMENALRLRLEDQRQYLADLNQSSESESGEWED